jgi:hypothetical protein
VRLCRPRPTRTVQSVLCYGLEPPFRRSYRRRPDFYGALDFTRSRWALLCVARFASPRRAPRLCMRDLPPPRELRGTSSGECATQTDHEVVAVVNDVLRAYRICKGSRTRSKNRSLFSGSHLRRRRARKGSGLLLPRADNICTMYIPPLGIPVRLGSTRLDCFPGVWAGGRTGRRLGTMARSHPVKNTTIMHIIGSGAVQSTNLREMRTSKDGSGKEPDQP